MGEYTITKTSSNIVFYTNPNNAYFTNSFVTYQIVYVDQGRNGYRFAALKKLVKLIESGRIQCVSDLATAMIPDITIQHTMRKPWLYEVTELTR